MGKGGRRGRPVRRPTAPAQRRRDPPRSIYENRRQARKVQWVSAGALLSMVGSIWWGIALIRGAGPGHEDDIYWGAFVAIFGLLFGACAAVYRRVYAVRLVTDGAMVTVTTLGWVFATDDVYEIPDLVSVHRRGDAYINGVQAPWLTLRVERRRIPYVIDVQAERVDERAIRGLVRRRQND